MRFRGQVVGAITIGSADGGHQGDAHGLLTQCLEDVAHGTVVHMLAGLEATHLSADFQNTANDFVAKYHRVLRVAPRGVAG